MYYYLSFLRPPPALVHVGEGSITITPQIANDLRTELKEDEPTDIFYTWQRIAPSVLDSTRSAKLTTYQPPINTYKAISVPLPTTAKPSESWRLGLFSPPASTVRGSLDCLAKHNCGVWSEPIAFLGGRPIKGKADKQGAIKQGRVFREWQVGPVVAEQGPDNVLRVVEQTSFDLDKKIWDSGLALSAWLHAHLSSPAPKQHKQVTKYLSRLTQSSGDGRIIELGAGTGLVSFAIGSAVRRLKHTSSGTLDIYATDLDSAIPLIDENTALNSRLWKSPPRVVDEDAAGEETGDVISREISVHSRVLDWDEPIPAWANEGGITLVIAADVTYNTASFPSLVNTLVGLLQPDAEGHAPMLLLAYKERDPSERELWDMVRARGLTLELVDTITGHEEEGMTGATEIWIGGFGKSSEP
ncbi:hypothetical protein NliqN6_0743 [Naganishia liquefaciens]|uniref:Methyltransferase n=1 Tax=Naganishia liquefaciens TaxID=104408 RepID=A0A8H3YE23_9TREE|nr:hypothetical protein NliqN6_0743 [Naganishia liquefaciens]